MPSFWNSPYFVADVDNWHLTEDAPEELKKEFEEYMKEPEGLTLEQIYEMSVKGKA
jgi:hypothetical protein